LNEGLLGLIQMPLSRGEQGGVPTALELGCDVGLGHLSAKSPQCCALQRGKAPYYWAMVGWSNL
jgi:hypothetical protein